MVAVMVGAAVYVSAVGQLEDRVCRAWRLGWRRVKVTVVEK